MGRTQHLLAASFWLVALWAGSAGAQSAAPASASAPAAVAPATLTPVAEIGPQAEQVAEQLRRMTDAISDEAPFAALEAEVTDVSRRAAQRWEETGQLLDRAPRRAELDALEGAWNALRIDFDRLGDNLAARIERRESDLATLAALAESWTASRKLAEEAAVPALLLERVDATLAAIAATRAAVERRRDRVLVLQDTVSRALQSSDDSLGRIQDARRDAVERAFTSRERTAWQALGEGRLQNAPGNELLGQQAREWLAPLRSYLKAHSKPLVFTLLLWPLLGWLLRWIGAPSPLASGFLFTMALTIPLRTETPVILRQLVLVMVLCATLALLRPLVNARAFAAATALSGLLVLDLGRTLLWVWPGLEQAMLLAEFTLAAGVLLWAGMDLPAPWRNRSATLWMPRVFAGASLLAAGLAAFGFLELADFVGNGVMTLACVGIGVHALRAAVEQVVTLARGRLPTHGLSRLEQGTQRLLDLAAIGVWLMVAIDRYELRETATDALTRLLGARAQLGGLSLSLGGTLGFVATVLAGWLLSRVVVFVLEVGVFPRTSLPRGVPYALTSLARYGVLLAAFLIALAAIGLDLTHLTLLVSALGLGLGFGLQQIVQNFVSGLILLFERPVQIGDAVQLGELTGQVERIGIRSSTLRTFDGAEVIVPNAKLIEDRITNWTLSDRRRRITLTLYVDPHEDPSRALALLLETAKNDPRVSNAPLPEALLTRIAETTLELELRVWTEEPNWMRVKSDLAVALHAALRAEG